jgi:hypothetical protein
MSIKTIFTVSASRNATGLKDKRIDLSRHMRQTATDDASSLH